MTVKIDVFFDMYRVFGVYLRPNYERQSSPRRFVRHNPLEMNKKYLFLPILLLLVVGLQAQRFEWNTRSPQQPQEVKANPTYDQAYNERQTGLAGVYNPNAQGTVTASGEAYVNSQMTASHPVLPVGTLVRVQNMDNNRVVNVRINDKGQECADCLLMLSQRAAEHLGVNYRGRVAVERVGFSNWNPAAPTVAGTTAAPAAYGQQGGVAQPVQINRQWEARGGQVNTAPQPAPAPVYANRQPVPTQRSYPAPQPTASAPATYGSAPAADDNYAVLSSPSAPSVMAREVPPATVERQPATYSRYPSTSQPRVYQPQATVTYQPAPTPSTTTYQQQPVRQNPTVRQAPPPPSTVARYQESRTVPAPATYQTPAAPAAYGTPATQTARGVATPAAASPAPAIRKGYAVQLAAYSNELYAKNRVAQLQGLGLGDVYYRSVTKPDGQVINRVYAGTFASVAEAQQAARFIQGQYQLAGIVSSL